jgi:hypothetical protein
VAVLCDPATCGPKELTRASRPWRAPTKLRDDEDGEILLIEKLSEELRQVPEIEARCAYCNMMYESRQSWKIMVAVGFDNVLENGRRGSSSQQGTPGAEIKT